MTGKPRRFLSLVGRIVCLGSLLACCAGCGSKQEETPKGYYTGPMKAKTPPPGNNPKAGQ